MSKIFKDKKELARALVILLELFAVGIIVYLIIFPFYPKIKYEISYNKASTKEEAKNLEKTKENVQKIISEIKASTKENQELNGEEKNGNEENGGNNNQAQTQAPVVGNRLIITKIGVNAPIVESENEEYGLNRGAWRVPETSTPDKGSNTVITGHRFKYLPPNNVTFYLLDKLEEGDIISVIWDDKDYYYKVKETKIVDKTETSVLNKSEEPILTLFTCDPIYSEEHRLVVVSELVE